MLVPKVILNSKQEALHVRTIAMICFMLALVWKFQYFRRLIYKPVEHLWWSFYCENSKPLNIFTKKLHRWCSFVFQMRLCFLKTLWTFYFFKVFYILRLYKNLLQSTLLLLIHQTCYFNWLEEKRLLTTC